jgi:hypothetical protein
VDWQVISSVLLSIVELVLVLSAGPFRDERFYLAAILAFVPRLTILHWLIAVHPLRIARIPGIFTVAAMSIMTVGVLAWGLLANLHATTAFHEYFGPMHTTAFAPWIGILCVLTASSVVSLRSLSSLLPPVGE